MKPTSEPRSSVPALRVRRAGAAPVADGEYVLYWMISARRARSNFALERAAEWARALERPLLVLEALRAAYPWASARLHRFVLDGMAHNARALAARGVGYFPYVEPAPGAGRGLLAALAGGAALVVTDEFPCFFLPRMVSVAASRLRVRFEVVDSNGLVPLAATSGASPSAFAFRRWLQRHLAEHLDAFPRLDALDALPAFDAFPRGVEKRWPAASAELLAGDARALAALPIDQTVAPVRTRGGGGEAELELDAFVAHKLARYGEDRNQPDDEGASGFSPYLHFGHLSAHEVFGAVAKAEGWKPARLGGRRDGRRGWYGMSASAEEFLDQLVTWRELGFAFARHRPADYDRYESLPDWARATLEEHAEPRARHYSLAQLERAGTEDELWNAAQTELLSTGKLHNYLRMLWGKKILEWSPSPREALARMIHLNNKYALDGRDPNSYSGIFWCLGRFDRPWGPKRPIFGTVRYMSSESTRRKLTLTEYLERFAPRDATQAELFERGGGERAKKKAASPERQR